MSDVSSLTRSCSRLSFVFESFTRELTCARDFLSVVAFLRFSAPSLIFSSFLEREKYKRVRTITPIQREYETRVSRTLLRVYTVPENSTGQLASFEVSSPRTDRPRVACRDDGPTPSGVELSLTPSVRRRQKSSQRSSRFQAASDDTRFACLPVLVRLHSNTICKSSRWERDDDLLA